MKRSLILMAAAAAVLTSCSNKEPVNTQTIGIPMMNLVSTPDGKNKISKGDYSFSIDYMSRTIATEASSLQALGNSLAFNLDAVSYDAYFLPNGLSKMVFRSNGGFVDGSTVPVSNFTGVLTDALVINTSFDGYRPTRGVTNAILSYTVGDETVRTFPATSYYGGRSSLKPVDSAKPNVNGFHAYVYVDMDALGTKAHVKLINVRTEDNGPYYAIDIKEASVMPSSSGYTIFGNDLEATLAGADSKTVRVNDLLLSPVSADLTTMVLECKIATIGDFTFQGSYTIGEDAQ